MQRAPLPERWGTYEFGMPRIATLAVLLATLVSAGCGPPPPPPPPPGGAATLTPTPTPLAFGKVYIGLSSSLTASWTSTYADKLVCTMAVDPAPPFDAPASIPDLAPNGTTGALSFTFTPTAVGPVNGKARMTVLSSAYAKVPVTIPDLPLSGSGVAQTSDTTLSLTGGNLTAGSVLDFGTALTGSSVSLTTNIANATAQPVTVTVTVLGAGPFSVTSPAAPLVVPAQASLLVTISFAPTTVGTFTGAVEFVRSTAGVRTAAAGTAVKGIGVAPPAPPKGG